MEIKTIVNSLVDLFFPMRCIHCNDVIPSSQILCVVCVADLPFTHWEMDTNNKVYKQLYQYCNVQSAYCLFHFSKKDVSQSILHEMKYRNRPELGQLLAHLVSIDLSAFDYIVPIPLHPKRIKQRGYNQVEAFARQLALDHKIIYLDDFLIRTSFQSSQVFKNKAERLLDLSKAFEIKDVSIKGHILVVDDLLTTGATLSQAILPMNDLEDVKVSVLTIACA